MDDSRADIGEMYQHRLKDVIVRERVIGDCFGKRMPGVVKKRPSFVISHGARNKMYANQSSDG